KALSNEIRELLPRFNQCLTKRFHSILMNHTNFKSSFRLAFTAAPPLLFSELVHAQISSTAGTLLANVNTWMLGIGGVVVTCALMFVGFRMVFQAAEWKDVAPVFWGGVLIGSAAAIGPQLIS